MRMRQEIGGWLIPDEAPPERLAHRLRTLFGMPQFLQNAAEAAKKAGRAGRSVLAEMILRLVPGSEDRPGWGRWHKVLPLISEPFTLSV